MTLIRTARDLKIGMMFSHQSKADLDPRMLSVVQACSAIQMTFNVRDAETRKWVKDSHGEEERTATSYQHGKTEGWTERTEFVPRIGDPEINYINANQRAFILNTAHSGFTQLRHAAIVESLPHFLNAEKVDHYLANYQMGAGPGRVLNIDDPTIDGLEDPEVPEPPIQQPNKAEREEILAMIRAAANEL
jgi:hypothetical protein